MTDVTGLQMSEAARVAAQFGVSNEQVRRDHLSSLILAALEPHADELLFFGGTALARTHLPDGRLSEDIDLIALGERAEIAPRVVASIERALRRSHGTTSWSAPLAAVREVDPVVLSVDDGLKVRIQLLRQAGYPSWPTERRDIVQRYSDARPTRLQVPTLPAFVAGKTAAWVDRSAARDLYDLWALANIGALTADAADLFAHSGPTSGLPQPWMFIRAPEQGSWRDQLAGQTRLHVTAQEALDVVRLAWAAVASRTSN